MNFETRIEQLKIDGGEVAKEIKDLQSELDKINETGGDQYQIAITTISWN